MWTFFIIVLGHALIHLARDYIKEKKKNQQIARATCDANLCIQKIKRGPLRKENNIGQY